MKELDAVVIPQGAIRTIVHVYPDGKYCEVEFGPPINEVVMMRIDALRRKEG